MSYSCQNCVNLKTRIITKSNFKNLNKKKIHRALDIHDTDSLGLAFPFNLTVYKRINKDGECKIIFCSQYMFIRSLYIYRDNLDLHSLSQNKNKPCPKYK